jgi:hypothetical protein
LLLEQADDTVISNHLVFALGFVGVDEGFHGKDVAGDNARAIEQLLGLAVIVASSRGQRIGNGQEDDLDKLDANDL